MPYDPQKHHRRSIRLKGYDYTRPGAYFITICTKHRAWLFGEVVDGRMVLNEMGEIVHFTWHDLPNHLPHIRLDEFVIMPNHIHGIVWIVNERPADIDVRAGSEPARTEPARTSSARTRRHGLPEIVRQFKTFSARRINQLRQTPGVPVWQRNYYEHIIRDAGALHRIRWYIRNNPRRWDRDRNR